MSLETNPYEPPRLPPTRRLSWWSRLLRIFRVPPSGSTVERFLGGERMFYYGVVFRVDPRDDESFTASLPLLDDDHVKVQRNIAEACRVAAALMTVYPELLISFRDRALVISMVPSYQELDQEIRRAVVPAGQWNQYLDQSSNVEY